MNTASYQCHRKPDACGDEELKEIGDFSWRFLGGNGVDPVGMAVMLPQGNGRGRIDWIPIVKGPAPAPKYPWGWDGNLDAPTLTPSLLLEGGWHGYMKAGRLESC
jgi:hypothetical protein